MKLPIFLVLLITYLLWIPLLSTAAEVDEAASNLAQSYISGFNSSETGQRTAPPAPKMVAQAAKQKPARKQSQPVSITADQMEADDKKHVVVFTGTVVARQEDMVLNCDFMRVYYRKIRTGSESTDALGFTNAQNEIDRIEAEGNVKITRGGQVAQAQKAIYHARAVPRTIVLTGEPRIWRDKDFLTGKRIIYYLDENRSVVEGGGNQRVNAVFYQSSGQPAKPSPEEPHRKQNTQ